ncbi:MAG: aminomethyltransferase family protein [Acidobacteriota bacterium]|nr:MAG: aminomethyltransferase family protein [Acidobacteriota bacterium]
MGIGTPFHSRTSALCKSLNWREWAGCFTACSYEVLHEPEYFAIRHSAALIDVSPLFKYKVRGRDAARFVDRVATRDFTKCAVGQVFYTPWCDDEGKTVDDGTVQRLDENVFRIAAAEPNLRWFHMNAAGLDVELEDESRDVAAAALQGPTSRDILKRVSDADLDSLKFFRVTRAAMDGIPVEISRTGYTGDLGYEIWVPAKDAERVWDVLMDAGEAYGIRPAGILALDVARIEAGLIQIDVDYTSSLRALIPSQKYSPFELGLDWTVKLDKGADFVGRRALLEEKRKGPPRRLVGLAVDWDEFESLHEAMGLPPQVPSAAWRVSKPLYAGGRQVGRATSGTWSPMLKKYIAFGIVESRCAPLGGRLKMDISVEHQTRQVTVTVVRTLFFDPPRKRA